MQEEDSYILPKVQGLVKMVLCIVSIDHHINKSPGSGENRSHYKMLHSDFLKGVIEIRS